MELFSFKEIVKITKAPILGAIRNHLNAIHVDFIDDISQETYIRLFKFLKKTKNIDYSKITSLAYKIAKNEVYRFSGKLQREETKILKVQSNWELKNIKQSENEIPYSEIEFLKYINQLPEKYKNIFLLLVKGLKPKEIGKILQLNTSTLKSRVFRGKQLLLKNKEKKYEVN